MFWAFRALFTPASRRMRHFMFLANLFPSLDSFVSDTRFVVIAYD